jgi:hypothetical protein
MELEQLTTAEESNPQHNPEFSLPPTDKGKDAYLFLVTCFVAEAFVWGISSSCYCAESWFLLMVL